MTATSPLYAYHDAGVTAPSQDARWAVTVQSGEGDPAPRVLAYARAEHIAKQICLALRQSHELALASTRRGAEAYVAAHSAADS